MNKVSERDTALIRAIETILTGIDKEETITDSGWWETSNGADFGARKLAEIRALFYEK